MSFMTALPYDGTSGWSGSDTSRDRALTNDADGTTSANQQATLEALTDAGFGGMTWKDLSEYKLWHHGVASGILSVLHKEGYIARLLERRDRCAVYVMPQFVAGRETAEHGRSKNEAYWRRVIIQDVQQFCDTNHHNKLFVPCDCAEIIGVIGASND